MAEYDAERSRRSTCCFRCENVPGCWHEKDDEKAYGSAYTTRNCRLILAWHDLLL